MTETAFLKVTDDIEMIKSYGLFLASILLDLSIALYTID